MTQQSRSWAASIVGFAFTMLAAAAAIYWAAHLIEAVWPVIAVAGGIVAVLAVAWRWLAWRSSQW